MNEGPWRRFFRDLPGAWLGNRPNGPGCEGHVTVDPEHAHEASRYIARHTSVRVTSTRLSPATGGLQFFLQST